MHGIEAMSGVFGVIMFIFFLYVALLALLMPIFILRIRNEVIRSNALLSDILEAVSGNHKHVMQEPKPG